MVDQWTVLHWANKYDPMCKSDCATCNGIPDPANGCDYCDIPKFTIGGIMTKERNEQTMKTKRLKGFKCIGRKGDDYYFADSTFKHRDDFQGVTGTVVRPVSTEEWDWASDPENVAERLLECYDGCKCDADWMNGDKYNDWVDMVICADGIAETMFDTSYTCDASDAFDEMGIEHEATDCNSCGRIFGRLGFDDFDEVFDREALMAINLIEAGVGCFGANASVVWKG